MLYHRDSTMIARDVLHAEAQAILDAVNRLDERITEAVDLLLACDSKVIVTGVGKSGHVARKIAATMCSTGTPAVFMHASEAVHGDLGIYTHGDPSILVSKSGTGDLMNLVPILREFRSPLVAITGNLNSPLAKAVDVVIDATARLEADPHNLAPTSSTTVAMALGDALAIALMQAKRFTPEDFVRYHPGGQLGRNLQLRVADVMQYGADFPWVSAEDPVKDVVIAMTKRPLGAACVVDDTYQLLGIITDGDLRRALVTHDDIRLLQAKDIMTTQPVTIGKDMLVKEALQLMEDRPSPISVLPVINSCQCIGLIRIHDIYRDGEGIENG